MGEISGNIEDVPFDFAGADRLISTCQSASSEVTWHASRWNSGVETASTDFRGYFSRLFTSNARTADSDARELATALTRMAEETTYLRDLARAEQERREKARAWQAEHDSFSGDLKGLASDATFGLAFGDHDQPPPGPQDPPPPRRVDPPTPTPRADPPPTAGSDGGTSSARPADLRTFAANADGATDTLQARQGTVSTDYDSFRAGTTWGVLEADGVVSGFDAFCQANRGDARWARVVADAFARAGSDGAVVRLADSALAASLQAAGVGATRDDLTIEMPQGVGHPPTSGYADDPVNTATGNFVETEIDLALTGGCADLRFSRTYNSVDDRTGDGGRALGTGWSAWTEAGVALDEERARVRLPEGREIHFGRLGAGWGRATDGNLWLERDGDRLVMRDNTGCRWTFDPAGHLLATTRGHGTGVRATWHEGRLTRLEHERGRGLDLVWSDPQSVDGPAQLVGLRADDGRRVDYTYDGAGRLVAATLPGGGVRRYSWDEDDRIDSVTDPDGVVEVENSYDEQGRVVAQRSPHGRVSRYAYLPGRVTVVSDDDGTRSDTWISDRRGRLVGAIDAHGERQSTAYDAHGNPVLLTERDGSVTVTEYDERGRRVHQVTPEGASLRWEHDDLDRVVAVAVHVEDEEVGRSSLTYAGTSRQPETLTDGEGGVTRFGWEDGLLREVADPTGVRLRLTHDEHGDLVATTDAEDRTARLERDHVGRVVAAVSPAGHRTTYDYDEPGRLVRRTEPDGAMFAYEHTAAGRLTAMVDPAGGRTSIEHGPDGGVATLTDPLGRSTTRRCDDLGLLASVELPDGTTWRYTHDALSRLVETLDPAGGRWQRRHDATGAVVASTEPDGVVRHASTDRAGGTARVSDALLSQEVRVDALGRVVAEVAADGATLLRRYDRCGRVVESVDEAGGSTTVVRDAAGRAVEVRSPSGATTHLAYDACGRLARRSDPDGAQTTFHRSEDGRLERVVSPTGEETTWRHDAVGRVLEHHQPGVGTTVLERDAMGRVTTVDEPRHGRRTLTWDAAGQLVAATDANGATTRYEHDAQGRTTAVVDALGARTERTYDVLGNLVEETDPRGRGRRWRYDAAGRLVGHTDATGTELAWAYDESGRLVATTVDGSPWTRVERDVAGRRLVVHESAREGRSGRRHELAWDARGLLVSRSRDERTVAWEHDAEGRVAARVAPDGERTAYAHDAGGRLTSMTHPLLGRVDVEHDADGRVVAAITGAARHRWTWSQGWLSAVESGGRDLPEGGHRTRVERDPSGRVLQLERDGEMTTYDYDQAHQLVGARTATARTRWRYDAAGRLVTETVERADGSRAVVERAFDAAGQPVHTVRDGAQTTHVHDAAGRRVRDEGPDGSRRDYTWGATGWLSAVADVDPVGGSEHHRLDVDALGELAAVDDLEVVWDTADPLRALLGLGGTAVVPGGPVTGVGGSWTDPTWRAGGHTEDPWSLLGGAEPVAGSGPASVAPTGELVVAGLEWLHARAYDPSTRGFLSRDPVDPAVGAPWAGNPYAFAGNDPLHALDPLGLAPMTDADLQAYRDAHSTPLNGVAGAVGGWMEDNWEYVAAGAMVVGGVALMATPLGPTVGIGLISAGIDTGLQKYTTGEVSWGQVAMSAALGAAGGGAASWAAKAATNGTRALATSVGFNAAIGGVSSEATYLVKNRDDLTLQGALGGGPGRRGRRRCRWCGGTRGRHAGPPGRSHRDQQGLPAGHRRHQLRRRLRRLRGQRPGPGPRRGRDGWADQRRVRDRRWCARRAGPRAGWGSRARARARCRSSPTSVSAAAPG